MAASPPRKQHSDVLKERAAVPMVHAPDVRDLMAVIPSSALLDAQWKPSREERDSLSYRHYRAISRARKHQQRTYHAEADEGLLPPI